MPSKQELGERIKRFRLERNLTLKEVEVKAKVSATHVSEIERGMTSPTVGALAKIARALGTEPSYFLQNDSHPAVSVVRKGKRRVMRYDEWGARIGCLNQGIAKSRMSFLEVELDPGLGQNLDPSTTHGGRAHPRPEGRCRDPRRSRAAPPQGGRLHPLRIDRAAHGEKHRRRDGAAAVGSVSAFLSVASGADRER